MESNNASSNAPDEQHAPTSIVCLYAMRDEPMYRELQTHLILWQTKEHIRWLELSAGADVEQTLQAFVQEADLILLLISSSFFATSLDHRVMESALAEQTKRGVLVVPILARAFDWKESACGGLRALPDNELPIAEWEHQERAYENIRAGLVRLIPSLAVQMVSLSVHPKHFQARDLPKGYVPRLKVFDEIKDLLLNRKGNQTTALRGAGGFGKTTLALALCHDPEIQAAFPDGILWVELGEQPPALKVLNGLLSSLETPYHEAIKLEEAQDRWRTALRDRVYLIVIDDVWQAIALEPLLEGGPHCVRLITTRNDQVLPKEATRVWVDAMEPEEAIAVLRWGLPEEIQQGVYQPELDALAKRLGCWSLLLALANGMLVEHVDYGQTLVQALETVKQAYQDRGVTAFDVGQPTARQQAVHASLEVSLRHLEEFTPARYQTGSRYQELAVFPADTDIPLSTLQVFWQATGNLKLWETKELCIHLHRLSLLLTCDLGNDTFRLHDVMRSYLIQRAGSHLPALHARLLDAYQQALGVTRWADLPRNEEYLWLYLIPHLCQANRKEALQDTLTDLDYLTRKAVYFGIFALEVDLMQACIFEQTHPVETIPSVFIFLSWRIRHLSHLLKQFHTHPEVGGLLLSYLEEHPLFATQRHTLELTLPRPFLASWYPLPEESSIRALRGHTDSVYECAVSPDGRFIVSASDDSTLKVWDGATGAERRTLKGHTSYVTGCAVSPDSKWIVSASYDHTLKVWDAVTGTELLTLTGHTNRVNSCAVSPDGRFIVSASSDHTLKVWDAATGIDLLTLTGHTVRVNGCAVSPDSRFIVSASWDETLKVWDSTTGAQLLTLTGHTNRVNGCAVSSDGQRIVSASGTTGDLLSDYTLKVWDAATGIDLLTLTGHSTRVTCCAVSPDGRFIVSASDTSIPSGFSYGTLKIWNAVTGRCLLTFPVHGALLGCAFHPDGEHLVACGEQGVYFLRLVM